MGKTSNEVKRRYNSKTYTEFHVSLKHEDYNKIEKITEEREISKAEFVRQAIKKFEDEKES